MAVYTNVTKSQVELLVKTYDIGNLLDYKPIEQGVENSNFFLYTDKDKYILTIYEKRVRKQDLPFYLNFTEHLANKNFPCPLPISNSEGHKLSKICNKPCAIISFLNGKAKANLQNIHIEELGTYIAKMHLASSDFNMQLENNFSLESWHELYDKVKDKADSLKDGLSAYIEMQLNYLSSRWPENIPVGVIHGDLFPDNVFYEKDKLVGIIDYYFSCNDFFMYDLAICLNAWCFEYHNEFNVTKAKKLLRSYNKIRKISENELNALPILASGSALRFLLTRLYDWFNHDENAVVQPKKPLEYLERLRFHNGIKYHTEYGL